MPNDSHVTTTYWPLVGQFHKGDTSQLVMKNNPVKPIASLSGKGTIREQKLMSVDARFGLMASALRATTALKGAADAVNLSHLQQIELIRTVIGEPVEYFALDEFFSTLNVDMLQAREAIQSTFSKQGYLNPLEEAEADEAKYDEISYNLLKLPTKIYTPIEDIMRTVINPQEISFKTANWALKKKRNNIARDVLEAGITTNTNVGVIDALAAGAFHSTNHIATNIADVINTHLKANDSLLTHIAMNNKDFAKYTENTWTSTGPTNMQFNRLIGAGSLPFPGVSGLTVVVDPAITEGVAFLVDKMNGSRLAEGPKTTRRYFDEEKDAEVIKMLDFNEYLIVNPDTNKVNRKFNAKISFQA